MGPIVAAAFTWAALLVGAFMLALAFETEVAALCFWTDVIGGLLGRGACFVGFTTPTFCPTTLGPGLTVWVCSLAWGWPLTCPPATWTPLDCCAPAVCMPRP